MSKRLLIFTLIALIFAAVLVLTNFGRNLPFFSFQQPVYTAEIPETRPVRLDQRLLERFEGESMADILAILAAEKTAANEENEAIPPAAPMPDPLGLSLPDAPFPFPASAVPADKEWLTDYVTSMKKDEATTPSPEEIRRFNLALSALQIGPETLPDSLKLAEGHFPESDTMAVRFLARENQLFSPFTIGNFDDTPDMELLDEGGMRVSKVTGPGAVTTVEDHGITFAGSRLYPSDFDGDGDLDLFLIRPDGFPNSLLRNDGKGHFEDVTIELGLLSFNDTTAAAWFDYDGDGLLDLLEGSRDHPLQLFHQTAGGSFQPIAWELKLWVHRGVREIEVSDLTGDGLDDLFLGLDDQPDRLLLTRAGSTWDAWRFEDVMEKLGAEDSTGEKVAFLDFDHDGKTDLARFGSPESGVGYFRLHKNEGGGAFTDVTEFLDLPTEIKVTSVAAIDFDLDGYDDLFLGTPALEINRVFWNRNGVEFREMTITTGVGYLDSPEAALSADFDRNGIPELLYRSSGGKIRWLEPTGSSSSWIELSFPKPMRGAKAVLTIRDGDWVLNSMTYILSGNSTESYGVGLADVIEKLEIFTPDGETLLYEQEKLKPNESSEILLPTLPKQRATAPLPPGSGE